MRQTDIDTLKKFTKEVVNLVEQDVVMRGLPVRPSEEKLTSSDAEYAVTRFALGELGPFRPKGFEKVIADRNLTALVQHISDCSETGVPVELLMCALDDPAFKSERVTGDYLGLPFHCRIVQVRGRNIAIIERAYVARELTDAEPD